MVENEKDKLPGRRPGLHLWESRDAGPVNFIGWFGLDIRNVRFSAPGARPLTVLLFLVVLEQLNHVLDQLGVGRVEQHAEGDVGVR